MNTVSTITDDIVDPILTAADVAKELRISKSHVHKLLRGEIADVTPLAHLSVGRRKIVPRSALERWKQENISSNIPESEKTAVTH